MSYQRLLKDVIQVCNGVYAEPVEKGTERALNKSLTLILNYYKLMQPNLFKDETVTAKLTLTEDSITNIQLIMSDNLEKEYSKGR